MDKKQVEELRNELAKPDGYLNLYNRAVSSVRAKFSVKRKPKRIKR